MVFSKNVFEKIGCPPAFFYLNNYKYGKHKKQLRNYI